MSDFERWPEQRAINVDGALLHAIEEMPYHDGFDGYIGHLHNEYEDFLLIEKIDEMSSYVFAGHDEVDPDMPGYESAQAFYEGALLAMSALHKAMGNELLQEWDDLEVCEDDGRTESVFALGDLYDGEELRAEAVTDFSEDGTIYISDATMAHVRNLSDESSIEPEAKALVEDGFSFVVHRAVEALSYMAPDMAPPPRVEGVDEMDIDSSAYLSEVVRDGEKWSERWDDVVAKLLYGYREK